MGCSFFLSLFGSYLFLVLSEKLFWCVLEINRIEIGRSRTSQEEKDVNVYNIKRLGPEAVKPEMSPLLYFSL